MTRHLEPALLTLSVLLWTFAFGYDAATDGASRLSLAVKAGALLLMGVYLVVYWTRRVRA